MLSPFSDVAAGLHFGPLFQLRPTPLPKRLSVRASSCNIGFHLIFLLSLLDYRSYMTASFMLCHSCTASHPSVGGSQLLLGPTIALGLFLNFRWHLTIRFHSQSHFFSALTGYTMASSLETSTCTAAVSICT
jgi:hypothetical protein